MRWFVVVTIWVFTCLCILILIPEVLAGWEKGLPAVLLESSDLLFVFVLLLLTGLRCGRHADWFSGLSWRRALLAPLRMVVALLIIGSTLNMGLDRITSPADWSLVALEARIAIDGILLFIGYIVWPGVLKLKPPLREKSEGKQGRTWDSGAAEKVEMDNDTPFPPLCKSCVSSMSISRRTDIKG